MYIYIYTSACVHILCIYARQEPNDPRQQFQQTRRATVPPLSLSLSLSRSLSFPLSLSPSTSCGTSSSAVRSLDGFGLRQSGDHAIHLMAFRDQRFFPTLFPWGTFLRDLPYLDTYTIHKCACIALFRGVCWQMLGSGVQHSKGFPQGSRLQPISGFWLRKLSRVLVENHTCIHSLIYIYTYMVWVVGWKGSSVVTVCVGGYGFTPPIWKCGGLYYDVSLLPGVIVVALAAIYLFELYSSIVWDPKHRCSER